MAFLRNAWYMAGWADELKPGAVLARTICGEPIAFFRGLEGQLGALEDRCCHRHYPLAAAGGSVVGNNIQCGYHGLQFDASGKCVKIPAQDRVPDSVRVRSYPVAERHRCVWLWMGDAARADLSAIPNPGFLDDPAWGWRGFRLPVKSSYRFLIENLLDLSHSTFLHGATIGTQDQTYRVDMNTVRGDDEVQVNRWMTNTEPPPTYRKLAELPAKVERWQLIRYIVPTMITLWSGAVPVGVNPREIMSPFGAPEGGRHGGLGLTLVNFLTPETERSSHYFWAGGEDNKPQDAALIDLMCKELAHAFDQDREACELQQVRTDEKPDAGRISLAADAGGVHAMRILDKAIEAEQQVKRAA
jgi:phenylpropionate dioxygenase-like ring-hydroxylating dioxygenase large terminal subunit